MLKSPFIKLDVTKRWADLIYFLPNNSILVIENVSQKSEVQELDLKTYLDFFYKLFPQYPQTAVDPEYKTLESLLFEYLLRGIATHVYKAWLRPHPIDNNLHTFHTLLLITAALP